MLSSRKSKDVETPQTKQMETIEKYHATRSPWNVIKSGQLLKEGHASTYQNKIEQKLLMAKTTCRARLKKKLTLDRKI